MTKPLIMRGDGTVGPGGLRLIEEMAANNKTQGTIAAALGVSLKRLKRMFERDKGENDVRLAWEAGHSQLEQRVADAMLAAGMGTVVEEDAVDETGKPIYEEDGVTRRKMLTRYVSKMGATQLIFYSKVMLGWTEKPSGPLVQDNRIQITLPSPVSTEDYFKMLGQSAPLDFRKDKSKSFEEFSKMSIPPPRDEAKEE